MHINNPSDANGQSFLELLESFDLKQSVNFKTHISGNTLDLVITKNHGLQIKEIVQNDPGVSDHFSVDFSLNLAKPRHMKKDIIYRDVKNIDLDSLRNDIKEIEFKKSGNVTEVAQSYQENLEIVFDKHAPIVTKTVTLRPNTKWYTKLIRDQRVIRRRKERKWKKVDLIVIIKILENNVTM